MQRVYRKVAHFCFGTTPQSEQEVYQLTGADILDTSSSTGSRKRKPLLLELSILKTVQTTVQRDKDMETGTEELVVRGRQQR